MAVRFTCYRMHRGICKQILWLQYRLESWKDTGGLSDLMPGTPESILFSSLEDFDVFIFCTCFGLPMHIGLVYTPMFSGPPFSPISPVLLVCFSTAWYSQHFNSVENFRYKKYSRQHSKMCPRTFKVIPF